MKIKVIGFGHHSLYRVQKVSIKAVLIGNRGASDETFRLILKT